MKHTFLVLLILGCSVADLSAQGRRRAAPTAHLYVAGKVHLGDGSVLAPGMVLVADGKISAVGASLEGPRGTRRIDLGPDSEITAGLIDAAGQGFQTPSAEEELTEVSPGARVVDGLDFTSKRFDALAKEGVTSVYCTSTNRHVIGPQGCVLATGSRDTDRVLSEKGTPKLVLSHDPSAGNGRPSRRSGNDLFVRRPTSQMGVNYVARDALSSAKDRLRLDAKAVESDADLAVLADLLAGKRAVRVFAEEQYEIATALRMAGEFGLSIVVERGSEAWRMLDELAAAKTPLIFGPVSRPESGGGRGRGDRSDLRPSTPAKLAERGIDFCITAAGQMNDEGLVAQVREAIRFGLAPDQALAAVTTVPARMLGMSDTLGAIAAGRRADLVIWTGAPFAATSGIREVLVAGMPQKEAGR